MLSKLTKIKILLTIIVLVGFLIKKDSLKEYLVTNVKSVVISDTTTNNGIIDGSKNKVILKVAILMIDLGLRDNVLQKALNTSPKVGLGFSIYAEALTNITQKSITKGHDTMILLPTQPLNYSKNDPGPYALLMDSQASENTRKFIQATEKLSTNDFGLYLSPSSAFPLKEDKATSLVKLLEDYDNKIKFFAYYDQSSSSFLTKLISTSHIANKIIMIDKIIDGSEQDVIESLKNLKNTDVIEGKILTIAMYPQVLNIKAVQNWINVNTNNIEIVSISDILKSREAKK